MSEGIEMSDFKQRRSAPTPPPRHPSSTTSNADTAAGGLGKAYRLAEEKAKAAVHLQEGGLDVIAFWGCGAAIWFTILSIPLLLFPRILLFFSQIAPVSHLSSTDQSAMYDSRDHYDALTPLESFLCRVVGAGLVAIALIILFALVPRYQPSTSGSGSSSGTSETSAPAYIPNPNPARVPLLGVLVGLTTLMSVVAYNTRTIGALGVLTGIGNAIIAIWGWWVIVFGSVKLEKRDSKVPKRLRKL